MIGLEVNKVITDDIDNLFEEDDNVRVVRTINDDDETSANMQVGMFLSNKYIIMYRKRCNCFKIWHFG